MPPEESDQLPKRDRSDSNLSLSRTDTRTSTRTDPAMPEESSSTGQSDSVRRSRPTAITTSGNNYGSITIPEHPEEESESQAQQAQSKQEQGRPNISRAESYPTRSPEVPQGSSKLKKPPMSRRASSRQGPHKGQNFSVDDDAEEIESLMQQRLSSAAAKAASSTLRRQPSTLRRRQTLHQVHLSRVDSRGEEEDEDNVELPQPKSAPAQTTTILDGNDEDLSEETPPQAEEEEEEEVDEGDSSDAESFTLKDRQQAINQTHPFGIRIWKPALYKKGRSVEKAAEGDIHSSPGGRVDKWLWFFNGVWTIFFGWWLALAVALASIVCFVLSPFPDTMAYGKVLWGLAGYLLFPFGKFVRLEQDEAYADEDEGEGRSITEYEQWQSGDIEDGRLFFGPPSSRGLVGRRRGSMDSADENDSLLGHTRSRGSEGESSRPKIKRRLFGRGDWTFGRVIFFVAFYFFIAPLMLLASAFCFFLVFWIPMGKVTLILFSHLRRHPLALSFHSDASYSRGRGPHTSSVLLCTYRAVGLKYWKYTIDGTNIFLINLIGIVLFVIFDFEVLVPILGENTFITTPGVIFALALFSVVPLAYFIGQAVASISAQSSMGVGAAINAFFSTVVEVFLYCVALNEGKGKLVEGSIIGSLFAGILFLPGLSMCFGAINRKTQRFNVKSAGVTSTMLLFAIIAAFSPTLFYQIYGSHELNCSSCVVVNETLSSHNDCRRCFYSQVPAINDRFFIEAVRPFCWFSAVMLFLAYLIGLWFTLRTHAAVIWNETEEKKTQPSSLANSNPKLSSYATGTVNRNAIRETQLYKRILGQSLQQVGLTPITSEALHPVHENSHQQGLTSPYLVPPKSADRDGPSNDNSSIIDGLSEEQNEHLVRQVAEMAATAATVAARDATMAPRKVHLQSHHHHQAPRRVASRAPTVVDDGEAPGVESGQGGGHDAPNWSRTKSAVILLGATLLYAIIAEILVKEVNVVLDSVKIDEKFLGITLFALVPNTTEFLNAISFAMNGNIALSMEIGSAYALQVCLLQVPALVFYSAVRGQWVDPADLMDYTFNLIFPQWDMITVILCVFLLSYVYGEGKSNYFKGSILCLTYFVIVLGFYLSGISALMDENGDDRFETFKTIGRGRMGQAF